MEYVEQITTIFSSIGGLGFLVGVIVLWKVGLLEFLLNIKKNGNGKQDEINRELFKHAEVANFEMGKVTTALALINQKLDRIEDDIKDLKHD